jgi:hypothetical protein
MLQQLTNRARLRSVPASLHPNLGFSELGLAWDALVLSRETDNVDDVQ